MESTQWTGVSRRLFSLILGAWGACEIGRESVAEAQKISNRERSQPVVVRIEESDVAPTQASEENVSRRRTTPQAHQDFAYYDADPINRFPVLTLEGSVRITGQSPLGIDFHHRHEAGAFSLLSGSVVLGPAMVRWHGTHLLGWIDDAVGGGLDSAFNERPAELREVASVQAMFGGFAEDNVYVALAGDLGIDHLGYLDNATLSNSLRGLGLTAGLGVFTRFNPDDRWLVDAMFTAGYGLYFSRDSGDSRQPYHYDLAKAGNPATGGFMHLEVQPYFRMTPELALFARWSYRHHFSSESAFKDVPIGTLELGFAVMGFH